MLTKVSEESIAILTALLMLFTAMFNPVVSFIAAAAGLVGLIIYHRRHA